MLCHICLQSKKSSVFYSKISPIFINFLRFNQEKDLNSLWRSLINLGKDERFCITTTEAENFVCFGLSQISKLNDKNYKTLPRKQILSSVRALIFDLKMNDGQNDLFISKIQFESLMNYLLDEYFLITKPAPLNLLIPRKLYLQNWTTKEVKIMTKRYFYNSHVPSIKDLIEFKIINECDELMIKNINLKDKLFPWNNVIINIKKHSNKNISYQ